jgi:hypothetical protein
MRRRFSRREAVATALNTDIANVDHYQYGRTKPVFTDGTNYYFATAKGEKPPADWDNWKLLSNEEWLRGYSVYEATV